jgi:hypothetical protein
MSPRLSPSPLPLLHEERERGGERSSGDPAPASVNDTESTNQHTPLPQRGRGVGGEGGPQRGSGVGGEGGPQRGSGARVCYALLALSAVRLEDDTQRLPK